MFAFAIELDFNQLHAKHIDIQIIYNRMTIVVLMKFLINFSIHPFIERRNRASFHKYGIRLRITKLGLVFKLLPERKHKK